MTNMESTREAFGKALVELGRENKDIVVLGGDLNKSTMAIMFGNEFPERFFDVGAAEQNMLSMAAGFAAAGKIPICTTFAVFGTGRAFDQIRVGIAQSKLNVNLVCTHAGLLTAEDGISAQSLEDLALMCSLPPMTVLTPSDGPETVSALKAAIATPGPVYMRLYRPATLVMHESGSHFKLGTIEILQNGSDVTLIGCGPLLESVLNAAEILKEQGISAEVLNVSTLKPLDEATLVKSITKTNAVVTAEEHYIHGGLGSMVASSLARNYPAPQEFIAMHQYAESGPAKPLLEKYGLSSNGIVEAAKKVISRKK
ncbi:MAG: transketolase [Chloroflexi bacterium]|nr:transketolase [Chloroflexota bacterium]|tara:strand:+ start:1035 stop:1973 length:939 start_codon:yes stop_codon:yes gene_type:complete